MQYPNGHEYMGGGIDIIEVKIGKIKYLLPNVCPMCHTGMHAEHIHYYLYTNQHGEKRLYLTYVCPVCYKPFITFHKLTFGELLSVDSNMGMYVAHFEYITPNYPDIATDYNDLNDLSPNFAEIYKQAELAETYNLTQIAGVGYRKALEFLVKDYLIDSLPDNESKDERITEIKKKWLGECINSEIKDGDMITLASRCAWLGNDETHYERDLPEWGLDDLKLLLKALILKIKTEMVIRDGLRVAGEIPHRNRNRN